MLPDLCRCLLVENLVIGNSGSLAEGSEGKGTTDICILLCIELVILQYRFTMAVTGFTV